MTNAHFATGRLPKVLMAASECAPFSKTGGLADVIGALPKSLRDLGVETRVITPYHRMIKNRLSDRVEHLFQFYVDLGWRHEYVGIEKRQGLSTRRSFKPDRALQRPDERLQPRLVGRAEAVEPRAVDVQHPGDPPVRVDGHHDFRIGGAVAGDVAGKGVHVRDELRRVLRPRGAADAAAARDLDAGGLALERPENELFVLDQIEPRPIQDREIVIDQRRSVRQILRAAPQNQRHGIGENPRLYQQNGC